VVKTASIVIVGAFALLLAACSGESEGGDAGKKADAAANQPAAPAAGGATMRVKADKTHAVQPNDVITLTIDLSGFQLSPDGIGSANQDGVGHYRVYLDTATGDDYLAVGADLTAKVTIPGDISDGSHDLRVVLHNNDKSPLEPPVEGSVLLIVYRL
jgi:hypothetical protein